MSIIGVEDALQHLLQLMVNLEKNSWASPYQMMVATNLDMINGGIYVEERLLPNNEWDSMVKAQGKNTNICTYKLTFFNHQRNMLDTGGIIIIFFPFVKSRLFTVIVFSVPFDYTL